MVGTKWTVPLFIAFAIAQLLLPFIFVLFNRMGVYFILFSYNILYNNTVFTMHTPQRATKNLKLFEFNMTLFSCYWAA
jgi:hypothetical protein